MPHGNEKEIKTAEEAYEKGMSLLDSNVYEAINLFHRAREINPSSRDAWYQEALARKKYADTFQKVSPYEYDRRKISPDAVVQYQEAVKALDKVLELLPKTASDEKWLGQPVAEKIQEIRYLKASWLSQTVKRTYDSAFTETEQAYGSIKTDYKDGHYQFGLFYAEHKCHERAIAIFDEVLRHEENDNNRCEILYQKVLMQDFGHYHQRANVFNTLHLIFKINSQHQGALDLLKKIRNIASPYPVSGYQNYYSLFNYYDFMESITHDEQEKLKCRYEKAQLWKGLGTSEGNAKAFFEFQEILRVSKDHYLKGQVYEALGKEDKAMECYRLSSSKAAEQRINSIERWPLKTKLFNGMIWFVAGAVFSFYLGIGFLMPVFAIGAAVIGHNLFRLLERATNKFETLPATSNSMTMVRTNRLSVTEVVLAIALLVSGLIGLALPAGWIAVLFIGASMLLVKAFAAAYEWDLVSHAREALSSKVVCTPQAGAGNEAAVSMALSSAASQTTVVMDMPKQESVTQQKEEWESPPVFYV